MVDRQKRSIQTIKNPNSSIVVGKTIRSRFKMFRNSIKIEQCTLCTLSQIYTLDKFIAGKGEEDIKTGIVKLKGSDIFPGEIVGIGGQYNTRYAIVA